MVCSKVKKYKYIENTDEQIQLKHNFILQKQFRSFKNRTGLNSLNWKWFQLLNLFDEICFLVVKLLVLGPVRVELGEEIHQLVLVSDQNVKDWLWFVWVCDKHLEHVERLELDVSRLFLQHVHHELEIVWVRDVFGHHREVVSV